MKRVENAGHASIAASFSAFQPETLQLEIPPLKREYILSIMRQTG